MLKYYFHFLILKGVRLWKEFNAATVVLGIIRMAYARIAGIKNKVL